MLQLLKTKTNKQWNFLEKSQHFVKSPANHLNNTLNLALCFGITPNVFNTENIPPKQLVSRHKDTVVLSFAGYRGYWGITV